MVPAPSPNARRPSPGTPTAARPRSSPTRLERSAATFSPLTSLAAVLPFSPRHVRNTTAAADSSNVLPLIVGFEVPQARIPTEPGLELIVFPEKTGSAQFMMWIASSEVPVMVFPVTTMSEWYSRAVKLWVPSARGTPSKRLRVIVTRSLAVPSCVLHTDPKPPVRGSGVSRLIASAVSREPRAASRNSLPEISQSEQASISMKWLLFIRVKVIPEIVTSRLCPAMMASELRTSARSITDRPPPAPAIVMPEAPSWPPTAPFFLPREGSISMNIEFEAENFFVPVFVPFTRVVPSDSRIVVLLGT